MIMEHFTSHYLIDIATTGIKPRSPRLQLQVEHTLGYGPSPRAKRKKLWVRYVFRFRDLHVALVPRILFSPRHLSLGRVLLSPYLHIPSSKSP